MAGSTESRSASSATSPARRGETANPSSASAMASSKSVGQFARPQRRCASSSSIGVPGVPTESPPTTASKKPIVVPSSLRNSLGVAAIGAVSRASSVVISPVAASYQTRNAPPPSPEDCGSTSPSTTCTATIASAALPPSRSTAAPASTASGLAAATIQSCEVTGAATSAVPVAASGASASAACCAWAGRAISAARARLCRRVVRMGLLLSVPALTMTAPAAEASPQAGRARSGVSRIGRWTMADRSPTPTPIHQTAT